MSGLSSRPRKQVNSPESRLGFEADDGEPLFADFQPILPSGLARQDAIAVGHFLAVQLHAALRNQPPRFGLARRKPSLRDHNDQRHGFGRQHLTFRRLRRKLSLAEALLELRCGYCGF